MYFVEPAHERENRVERVKLGRSGTAASSTFARELAHSRMVFNNHSQTVTESITLAA